MHTISIDGGTAAFACQADESVLAAMIRAGHREAIGGVCHSGGCGVCRVEVLGGDYEVGTMSSAEVTPDCRARGYALACQVFPRSDLRLRAAGKRVSDDGSDPYRRLFASVRAAY